MVMPGDNTDDHRRADGAGRARKGRALRDSRRRPHGRRRHDHGDHRVGVRAMRDIVTLACTECKRRNYSPTKN